jgi:hypothetical protein
VRCREVSFRFVLSFENLTFPVFFLNFYSVTLEIAVNGRKIFARRFFNADRLDPRALDNARWVYKFVLGNVDGCIQAGDAVTLRFYDFVQPYAEPGSLIVIRYLTAKPVGYAPQADYMGPVQFRLGKCLPFFF